MSEITLPAGMGGSTTFDVIIVGAGPAGLSAALTAVEHGLSVVVVDEQHEVGGQIFRQLPNTFAAPPSSAFKSYAFGAQLLASARSSKAIAWRMGATAWGAFRCNETGHLRLGIATGDDAELLEGHTLLIATGAYDLPVAFPGWTLPGVMSAGGIQTLVKSQFLRAGKRFVLAGSHPLLLLVADLLVQVGADVLEVAVARPRPSARELLGSWQAAPGHLRLLTQTAQALRNLRKHRVPIRFGTLVVRADGDHAVQQVTLCDVDESWRARAGSERVLQADTLVVGYGLLASSELARQAGCKVQWRPAEGGWVVQHDTDMQTSEDAIYVAGEPAGVNGAQIAFLEGRQAALSIVARLRHKGAPGALAEPMEQTKLAIRKARRFTDTVLRFFEPRLEALARLATEETLVCRCEEVSASTVHNFLADNPHVSDVNSVKLACRTGMGHCQGRYCQHTVAHLLEQRGGTPIEKLGIFTAQVPVKPVSVMALAQLAQGFSPEPNGSVPQSGSARSQPRSASAVNSNT